MNRNKRVFEVAAALVFIALPVLAKTNLSGRDQRVVSFIHQANLQEIEASKVAQEKSGSEDVKRFADQMIADHQSADQLVRSYAEQHQLDLDTLRQHLREVNDQRLEYERQTRSLGTATGEWAFTWENENVAKNEDQQALARLRGLDGAAFDREFANVMVKDHQKVIERLTDVRDHGIDPDLKSLIDRLLPTLKHHLAMSQALQGVVAKA